MEPMQTESRADGARAPVVPPRWLAVSAVLLAAVVWSSSYAVTKVALTEVPPLTVGALRFAGAALVLGVLVRVRGDRASLTAGQRTRVAGAGLLGITAYFALENIGVDLATASDATLIVASYPVFTLVIEIAARRATFAPVRVLGMLVAMTGVWVVVSAGGGNGGQHHLAGDLILLAGGVAWAVFNVVARSDVDGSSVLAVTYHQTLAGAGGFALLSLLEADQWRDAPSGGTVLRLVFLAVCCSVVAFLAYNFGLRVLDASAAVNLLNVVPVLGLVWAAVLAGEHVGIAQMAGGVVVVIGVSLGLMRTRRERAEASLEPAAPTRAGAPT